MISSEQIRALKDRVDIVEVISRNVVLKRKGKNFVGLCPFHQENTSSFCVSPDRKIYTCFGCKQSGDAISFIRQTQGLSFSEAVFQLADEVNMPIESDTFNREDWAEKKAAREKEKKHQAWITSALKEAVTFYRQQLRANHKAKDYLISRLGSEEAINEFQLGYAKPRSNTLTQNLTRIYPVEILLEANLVRYSDGGEIVDFFQSGIMIPIFDGKGNPIGFGCRTSGKNQPKYINSPNLDKNHTLYNLHKASETISHTHRAIVVEGYFDAMALYCKGFHETVAVMGTNLSTSHVQTLSRFVGGGTIFINLDNDPAGVKASIRITETFKLQIKVGLIDFKFVTLDDCKDVDEYLAGKNGTARSSYENRLNEAQSVLDWRLDALFKGYNPNSMAEYNRRRSDSIQLLNEIEDEAIRNTVFLLKCASRLVCGDTNRYPLVVEDLQKALRKVKKVTPPIIKASESPVLSPHALGPEKLLITLYLTYPDKRQEIEDFLEDEGIVFFAKECREAWRAILTEPDNRDSTDLTFAVQDELKALGLDLQKDYLVGKFDGESVEVTLEATKLRLLEESIRVYKRSCTKAWSIAVDKMEIQSASWYVNEMQQAEEKLSSVSKQLLELTAR